MSLQQNLDLCCCSRRVWRQVNGCTCIICLYAHAHALVVVLAYAHVHVLVDVLLDVLEYVLVLVSGASGASAGPFRTCRHFELAGPAAISNLQPLYLNMHM